LEGENFGAHLRTLKVWVTGKKLLTSGIDGADTDDKGEIKASETTIKFMVFNGTANTTDFKDLSSVLNRGFSGCAKSFCFAHSHSRIVVRGPRGYGPDCTIHISVAGQTASLPFAFKPPIADFSEPRAYDANGQKIVIHGRNFGGEPSDASIQINGEECDNAKWHREHPVRGLPYISCSARRTITGIANASVFVAGQSSNILIASSSAAAGVRTICREAASDIDLETGQAQEYWGRNEPVGELCTKCVEGLSCQDNTYNEPFSIKNYYMVDLDISGGRKALQITLDGADGVSRRERRNYETALEKIPKSGERKCPPERLFDSQVDAELVKSYPFASEHKRDICKVAMPCKPAEACAGRNTCSEGYEWNLNRCNASSARFDSDKNVPIVQFCNHTLQCQVRSSGLGCARAISEVCGCPADWEIGGHSCLKKCVRDNDKAALLTATEAGCDLKTVMRSLSGSDCPYGRPEDCAKCVGSKVCSNDASQSCHSDYDCGSGNRCEMRGSCSCASSNRCIFCTAGKHYRRDGKCVECPKNVELIVALFFIGIFVCISGAYVLDQKDFNLAFISIPVDYFQVLALFSRADIRWPPILLEILYALRFFNVNIDVATPECLLAGFFTYSMKFYATLLLPPVAVVFLILAYFGHICFRKCVLNRKIDKFYKSKLIGTFMLIIYFSFLSCTTRALEIFNCSPTDPDDGWTYVDFTDESCDGGGLCRCGDPEHLPAKLALPALLALCVYTLGFPLFLVWLLRCGNRKNAIKEDQVLRAAGCGDDLNSNPNAFFLRIKYHKMYYYFKPGKTYWLLYILERKASIALAGLIFRTNPGFMLASVLLVLFVSYMMQIRHQPYMSTSQRNICLAEHKIKAEAGDPVHKRIAYNIERALADRKLKMERLTSKKGINTGGSFGLNGFTTKTRESIGVKKKVNKARQYFFDYNTVEQVLLACAVFVCLSGVMFESDRFQALDASGKLRYGWQRDIVTFLVVFVVIGSLCYLLLVMLSEVIGFTPGWVKRACTNKKQHALMSAADTIQNHKDEAIEMNMINPSMANGMDKSAQKQLEDRMMLAEKEAAELREDRTRLQEERRKLKALATYHKSGSFRKPKKTKKANKTEFNQQRAGSGSASKNELNI